MEPTHCAHEVVESWFWHRFLDNIRQIFLPTIQVAWFALSEIPLRLEEPVWQWVEGIVDFETLTRQKNVMSLLQSLENPRSQNKKMLTCRAWRLGVLIHQWIDCFICAKLFTESLKKKKKSSCSEKIRNYKMYSHFPFSRLSNSNIPFLTKLLSSIPPSAHTYWSPTTPPDIAKFTQAPDLCPFMSTLESMASCASYILTNSLNSPVPLTLLSLPCHLPVSGLASTTLPSILWINIL